MLTCIIRVGYSLLCIMLLVLGICLLVMYYASLNVLGVILRVNFDFDLRKPSNLVPIWFEIPDDINYGNWTRSLSIASLCLFIVPLLQGFIGSFLICYPKIWLAVLVVCCGMIGLVVQSVFFAQLIDTSSYTHQSALRKLQEVIDRDYQVMPGNSATASFNAIMIMGECCGLSGPGDFSKASLNVTFKVGVNPYENVTIPRWISDKYNIPYVNMTYKSALKVPPVCCDSSVFQASNELMRINEAIHCAAQSHSANLNKQGCYTYYFKTYIVTGISVGFYTSIVVGITWAALGMVTPFVVEEVPSDFM